MALLTAQLLFLERIAPDTVQLDVVVSDRAECAVSPPVGAPLSFRFRLPTAAGWQEPVASALTSWARRSAFVDMSVLERKGRTRVLVSTGTSQVTLDPPTRPG